MEDRMDPAAVKCVRESGKSSHAIFYRILRCVARREKRNQDLHPWRITIVNLLVQEAHLRCGAGVPARESLPGNISSACERERASGIRALFFHGKIGGRDVRTTLANPVLQKRRLLSLVMRTPPTSAIRCGTDLKRARLRF